VLTLEEAARLSVEDRFERLAEGPEAVARAVAGHGEAALARRPDSRNWAPVEVICHLRDTEESFLGRFRAILVFPEPALEGPDVDRWAEDRQYLRHDPARALAAFRRHREETLAALRTLGPAEWQRAGVHPRRGRMTLADFLALMVWHDENHLDQLRRALDGKP
jgi:uncharacterized damage-inducible protein DinB